MILRQRKDDAMKKMLMALAAVATLATTAVTAPAPADDLFPEHKKDEQFEIPAFLRRQTN